VDSLGHKNRQKLKNVFGKEIKLEQLEAAADLIRKIQSIGEEVARLQATAHSDRARRLCEFLKREVSRRIIKMSNKVHKITEAGKLRSGRGFASNKFDFLRNDEEFKYVLETPKDSAQRFESELRRMENAEMSRLTESIEAVSKLFLNMNHLVIEQGTVIDRIDANLSVTVEKVQSANSQLIRAIEHQNSGLADFMIKVLGVLVLVLAALLFFKYS
jgi:uncharacterized coiled-coil protein SlyX